MKTKHHKVEIGQKLINKGERGNCGRCPVALALLEIVPSVDVGYEAVVMYDVSSEKYQGEDPIGRFELPSAAKKFVADFDAGKFVKPFSFFLRYK